MKSIIAYGDSNTYGYDPRSFFGGRYPEGSIWTNVLSLNAGVPVENMGRNGRMIPTEPAEIQILKDVLAAKAQEASASAGPSDPRPLVGLWIMLGSNDILNGVGAQEAAGRMAQLAVALANEPAVKDGTAKIRLIAPPPLKSGNWVTDSIMKEESADYSKYLKVLAEKTGCEYTDAGTFEIPLLFDGVHFSEKGHRIFAQAMWNVLLTCGEIGR